MLGRRQLIAAAIAGIAGVSTWRFLGSSDENAVIEVLRKRLDYLVMDEQGTYAYARDLVARQIVASGKLRLLDALGPLYRRFSAGPNRNVLTRELQHGEERIVSFYLLSSDFFANGADETKLVRYLGYYEPLHRPHPCSSPFARSPMT